MSIIGTNNVDQQRINQENSNSERLDLQDGPSSLKCHSDTSSSDLEPVPDVVLTATSSLESPHNLEVQCEPTTKAELEPENQDTSSNKNVSELPELYDSGLNYLILHWKYRYHSKSHTRLSPTLTMKMC